MEYLSEEGSCEHGSALQAVCSASDLPVHWWSTLYEHHLHPNHDPGDAQPQHSCDMSRKVKTHEVLARTCRGLFQITAQLKPSKLVINITKSDIVGSNRNNSSSSDTRSRIVLEHRKSSLPACQHDDDSTAEACVQYPPAHLSSKFAALDGLLQHVTQGSIHVTIRSDHRVVTKMPCTIPANIARNVETLVLCGYELGVASVWDLQLSKMHCLQRIEMHHCRAAGDGSFHMVSHALRPAQHVQHVWVDSVICTSSAMEYVCENFISGLLASKSMQLRLSEASTRLPRFCGQLRWPFVTTVHLDYYVNSADMKSLLVMPAVKEVLIGGCVCLDEDFSSSDCKWDKVELVEASLEALPLLPGVAKPGHAVTPTRVAVRRLHDPKSSDQKAATPYIDGNTAFDFVAAEDGCADLRDVSYPPLISALTARVTSQRPGQRVTVKAAKMWAWISDQSWFSPECVSVLDLEDSVPFTLFSDDPDGPAASIRLFLRRLMQAGTVQAVNIGEPSMPFDDWVSFFQHLAGWRTDIEQHNPWVKNDAGFSQTATPGDAASGDARSCLTVTFTGVMKWPFPNHWQDRLKVLANAAGVTFAIEECDMPAQFELPVFQQAGMQPPLLVYGVPWLEPW